MRKAGTAQAERDVRDRQEEHQSAGRQHEGATVTPRPLRRDSRTLAERRIDQIKTENLEHFLAQRVKLCHDIPIPIAELLNDTTVDLLADDMTRQLVARYTTQCMGYKFEDRAELLFIPKTWFQHLLSDLSRGRLAKLFLWINPKYDTVPRILVTYNLCPHTENPKKADHFTFMAYKPAS